MEQFSDDFAPLDGAFYLPEHIEDTNLRQLYEVLVSRMRREAATLPMNTVQQLLIERIAYNYIVMREKERSEERRVGKECPSKCRSRWSPYH